MVATILWFDQIKKDDIPLVGGKGANLGEMVNNGFPVPPGFCVSAQTYFRFVEETNIQSQILEIINSLDHEDIVELNQASKKIKDLIISQKVPEDIEKAIRNAYETLGEKKTGWLVTKQDEWVAVRSSATAEDLPEASFAGQQETFLNIKGGSQVVDKVKRCWASLFTPRAIYYRHKNNFKTEEVGLCAIVQKMVSSDVAGIMFTVDPTGDDTKLVIDAAYGLGESVVSGSLTPDHYVVDKATMTIADKKVITQEWKLERVPLGIGNKKTEIDQETGSKQKFSDDQILGLAEIGKEIETYYGSPQDIEWALEGDSIYIVQSRPVTALEKMQEAKEVGKDIEIDESEEFLRGFPASPGVVAGKAKVILDDENYSKLNEGEILVTKMTSPDMVPIMKKAGGIITDEGGIACHAAIVSRELGIPCIVGTEKATELIKDNDQLTMDAVKGIVYRGEKTDIESEAQSEEEIENDIVSKTEEIQEEEFEDQNSEILNPKKDDLGIDHIEDHETKRPFKVSPKTISRKEEALAESHILHPRFTKVKVNVALSLAAERAGKTHADGIGLLRAEHMITKDGKHPAWYVENNKLDELEENIYNDIIHVASFFGKDKPIWYRTLDARTDEFSKLEGGDIDKEEDNPMLGWHGIRRELGQPGLLKAEFKAIKRVKEEGYNIGVMVPFIISVDELRQAKEIARSVDLIPHEDIQFGIMVETPASVQLIQDFCEEGIDFASMGTNDLTQLTLGLDRNNAKLQDLFHETHPAILRQAKHVIETCNNYGVESSICGQAASYPEMVEKLVEYGISSVSANIDAVAKIRKVVARKEHEMILKAARDMQHMKDLKEHFIEMSKRWSHYEKR